MTEQTSEAAMLNATTLFAIGLQNNKKQCLNIQTIWRTWLYYQLQFCTQAQVGRSDTATIKQNATRKSQLQFSPSFCIDAVCTEKIYDSFSCFLLCVHLTHHDMCSPPVLPYTYW